jgi:hypothetical protein
MNSTLRPNSAVIFHHSHRPHLNQSLFPISSSSFPSSFLVVIIASVFVSGRLVCFSFFIMFHNLGLGALLAATAGAILIPPAVDVAGDDPIFRITVPIPPNRHSHDNPFAALSPFRHAVGKGPAFLHPPKVADKGVWGIYLLPIKGSHESLVSSDSHVLRFNADMSSS